MGAALRDVGEMERAVAAFSRSPNGGMIVTGSAQAAVHRDLIITLAARNKLPAPHRLEPIHVIADQKCQNVRPGHRL